MLQRRTRCGKLLRQRWGEHRDWRAEALQARAPGAAQRDHQARSSDVLAGGRIQVQLAQRGACTRGEGRQGGVVHTCCAVREAQLHPQLRVRRSCAPGAANACDARTQVQRQVFQEHNQHLGGLVRLRVSKDAPLNLSRIGDTSGGHGTLVGVS